MNPLAVFQARAEARAVLWQAGEYADEDSAIAPLLDAAYAVGLVDRFGEAALMQIVDAAFAPFRESQ